MFKTAIQMVKCFFTPEAEKKAILFKKSMLITTRHIWQSSIILTAGL